MSETMCKFEEKLGIVNLFGMKIGKFEVNFHQVKIYLNGMFTLCVCICAREVMGT